MGLDVDLHHHIAVGTAVVAHVALAADGHDLLVIHTGGNLDVELVIAADLALAAAGVTGVLDDLALAVTLGAGCGGLHGHAHEILGGPDLAGAAAAVTGLHGAVCRAGAGTGRTVLDPGCGNFLLGAESSLLKGHFDPGVHVLAPSGCVGAGPAAAESAATAENVAENVAEVTETAESAATKSTAAVACVEIGIHAGMAVLVIAAALVVVGQHFVGLAHFLELGFCLRIVGVPVRMVLHGLLAVGPLYLISAGALFHAQHFIKIALVVCHFVTSISRGWAGAWQCTPPRPRGSLPRCSPAGPQR